MDDLSPNARFAMRAAPTEWADYADELKDAIDLLWKQSDQGLIVSSSADGHILKKSHVSRTFVLLAGFALENLFKGIVVAIDSTHVQNGKLSKSLKSHGLIQLAALARESLDDRETNFCLIAEGAIPYWGRYPIPLSADGLQNEVPMSGSHQEVFHALHVRLRRRLHGLLKNGWISGEEVDLKSVRNSRWDPPTLPSEVNFEVQQSASRFITFLRCAKA